MWFTTKLTMEQCYDELTSSVKLKLIKGKIKSVRNSAGDLESITFSDRGYHKDYSLWRKRNPIWITIHGRITPNQEDVGIVLKLQYGYASIKVIITAFIVGILVILYMTQFGDSMLVLYWILILIMVGAHFGISYFASMYSDLAKEKEQEMLNYIINRLQLYQVG